MDRRVKWNDYEDKCLQQIVEKYLKGKNWDKISLLMSLEGFNKSYRQCRERWTHHLNPNLNKNVWNN